MCRRWAGRRSRKSPSGTALLRERAKALETGGSTVSAPLRKGLRPESLRQQFAGGLLLDRAVYVGHDHPDRIPKLQQRLPAAAASSAGPRRRRDDRDGDETALTARDGVSDRRSLRAPRQAVGRILHVAPKVHVAAFTEQGGPHGKP